MSSFTRMGCAIWTWEPLMMLSSDCFKLWMALYTGSHAKGLIPGLWVGPVALMAHEARMGAIDTQNALNELIGANLFEYDAKARVLRFVELPDAGEWPQTPTILQTWWGRFGRIPACAVRDAHVSTMWKMIEDGAKLVAKSKTSGKPTAAHFEIWNETFGTVEIPVARRRGMRPVEHQTDLFRDPLVSPETVSRAASLEASAAVTSCRGVAGEPNDFNTRETDPRLSGERRRGEEKGSSSFSSSSPEPGRDLPGDLEQAAPQADAGARTRPHLTLVPPPADIAAVQAALDFLAHEVGGAVKSVIRLEAQQALCAQWACIPAESRGAPELALVGARLARDRTLIALYPGDPSSKLSLWLAGEGNYLRALAEQREHERVAAAKSAYLADLRQTAGF